MSDRIKTAEAALAAAQAELLAAVREEFPVGARVRQRHSPDVEFTVTRHSSHGMVWLRETGKSHDKLGHPGHLERIEAHESANRVLSSEEWEYSATDGCTSRRFRDVHTCARYTAFYSDPSPVTPEALEAMGWTDESLVTSHQNWHSPENPAGNWIQWVTTKGWYLWDDDGLVDFPAPASLGDLRHLLRGLGIPHGEPT